MYRAVPGTRIELLHGTWAAFSAASGETLQLNAEAAAVVELLLEAPRTPSQVAALLAVDTDTQPAQVAEALRDVWSQLLDAGLIRSVSPA